MAEKNEYQFIITGAGLAGLSFVHHLLKDEYFDGKVLLIDSSLKNKNDRTWSFWSSEGPEFKCAESRYWDSLGFACHDFIRFDKIEPYRYYSIRGIDFYNEIFAEIGRSDRVEFRNESVLSISPEEHSCLVKTDKGSYKSDFLIDSTNRPEIDKSKYYFNHQNFIGWEIETESSHFDESKAILMDFRVEQKNASSFVYFLPESPTKALVEYTQFTSVSKIEKDVYRKELKKYIHEVLGIKEFFLREEETGSIPMCNFPFDSRPNYRIFRLGTAGGDTKASTGYTFNNVQKHVRNILAELKGDRILFSDKQRFKFYDDLLLKIISENPERVESIMSELFKSQPIDRVLKFLDEDTNLLEEALIFQKLPWLPFLQALIKKRRHVFNS